MTFSRSLKTQKLLIKAFIKALKSKKAKQANSTQNH